MSEKKPLKVSKKAMIVEGVFILLAIVAAVYFLPNVVNLPFTGTEDASGQSVTIFDDQGGSHEGAGDSAFQRYTDDPQPDGGVDENSPVSELQKIISSKDDSYWQNWIWEEKMVLGVVQEVDNANSKMEMIITLPKGKEFSDIRRVAYMDCPLDKSGLIKGSEPEQTVKDSGVDILNTATSQDRLYVYCLDDSCLNLGKTCILTDMSQ